MADRSSDSRTPAKRRGGRTARRTHPWHTAISEVEPNRILVRGFPVDEMMGRVSFGEAVYLLLGGELPSPAIGRLMEALLVSFIDHGATPPSTLAARHVATTGAPLRACVAAGVLGFGKFHGADIRPCMQLLDAGLARMHAGASLASTVTELLQPFVDEGTTPPGFGHPLHTADPRAGRLFQLARDLEMEADHMHLMRGIERALQTGATSERPAVAINLEGAVAAVCGDLGLHVDIADALFTISRVPGLIAQAREEQAREPGMRLIDPGSVAYDGPDERRLPRDRR